MIHRHCRDQSRQVLRVPLRSERGARVKSEGARDRANAAGLEIGLGGSIVDWLCFTPNSLCKRIVCGLADIGTWLDFDLPSKEAPRRNTSCGERSQDLILAAARETMKEDGAASQSYAEGGRTIIVGRTSRHALGAGPIPSQFLAKLLCH